MIMKLQTLQGLILLCLMTAINACKPPCVLYSTINTISTIPVTANISTQTIKEVVKDGTATSTIALAYHKELGLMFWSDTSQNAKGQLAGVIKRANLDGSNVERILPGYYTNGLAVDYSANVLYWAVSLAGSDPSKIKASNINGSGITTLIQGGMGPKLCGLAIDVQAGFLFWSGTGLRTSAGNKPFMPQIYRADYNGKNLQILANVTGGDLVNSFIYVDLDYGMKKVYWIESTTKNFESADYTGANRKVHYQLTGGVTWCIGLLNSSLFYVDFDKALYQVDRASGNQTAKESMSAIRYLAIFDSSKQPNVDYCPVPKVTGVLKMTNCTTFRGGICNFTCPNGYQLVGKATLNCVAPDSKIPPAKPGSWDGRIPSCVGGPTVPPTTATKPGAGKGQGQGLSPVVIGVIAAVCAFIFIIVAGVCIYDRIYKSRRGNAELSSNNNLEYKEGRTVVQLDNPAYDGGVRS